MVICIEPTIFTMTVAKQLFDPFEHTPLPGFNVAWLMEFAELPEAFALITTVKDPCAGTVRALKPTSPVPEPQLGLAASVEVQLQLSKLLQLEFLGSARLTPVAGTVDEFVTVTVNCTGSPATALATLAVLPMFKTGTGTGTQANWADASSGA